MSIKNVSDKDFEEKILQSETPVLLDFFADRCGPCKLAEPVLEELSDEYKGKVDIAKIDVDQNSQTTERFGVRSIPTTILFKNGNEIDRQVGYAGKQHFVDLLQKAL